MVSARAVLQEWCALEWMEQTNHREALCHQDFRLTLITLL